MSENTDILTVETKTKLKNLSKSLLTLHKNLLEQSKAEYEAQNGKIDNPNTYLQLVLNHSHFAWLRKISSLIALLDEATSLRRPANETQAQSLLIEANRLLSFIESDDYFNDRFQVALSKNSEASVLHNQSLKLTQ